ncbi:MAG: hypothetical protein QOI73_38 [Solirubrobacteraceae bacterium]|nr:hypothetical protein [Solirubrobacteraceae bacterium]
MRRTAALLAGVLLLAAVLLLYERDNPAPYKKPGSVGVTIGGQAAVIVGPKTATRKVVVYAHGSGETAASSFGNQQMAPIFRALVDAGYAIAADDAHGDGWGNPTSYADYARLISKLEDRGLTEVYVIARSMGAFNGLQLLSTVHVKAWAGIVPACNLRSIHALGRFAPSIRAAYGPKLAGALRANSPVRIAYRPGLPMRFWASPGDTVVPKAQNTDLCAGDARARGARVTVTSTGGDHGDPSNYDPAGILGLFASAG